MINNKKRIVASIAAILFVATIVLSTIYVISHAEHEHEHEGTHCTICMHLTACEKAIRTIYKTAVLAISCTAVTFCFVKLLVLVRKIYTTETLVSLKIKLSN